MKRKLIRRSILRFAVICALASTYLGGGCTYSSSSYNSAKIDERMIYSAVIKEYLGTQPRPVLIGRKKLSYARPDYGLGGFETERRISHLKEVYPSVADDTLRDFDSKQLISSELDADFTLPFDFVLIEDSDDTGRDATQHNRSELNNIVTFSAIGFNKDRTEAFLFAQRACVPLCGQGDHFVLAREGENWKIVEIFAGWRT